VRWFTEARALADELLRSFHDDERGGFFQTGVHAEPLVIRPKELYDNAVPSGSSVAADVLQRIALLTGEAGYERAGVSSLRLVRDAMVRAPSGFGRALCALDLYLGPAREVAIVGEPDHADTQALIRAATSTYLPNAVVAAARPDDDDAMTAVPLLRDRGLLAGRAAAYVCERFVCGLPVSDPASLLEQLTEVSPRR
jgi:uncharacterized protein YyaL (SSP411 family)